MSAPAIYLAPPQLSLPATSPWYRYLTRVQRLRVGDKVRLLDGEGGQREAVLSQVDRAELRFEAGPLTEGPPMDTELILCPALLPHKRMDWLIEKTTELGVDVIQPISTEHTSVPAPTDDLPERLARWTRKASEAVRQSGRQALPEIRPPCSLAALLESVRAEGTGAQPSTLVWLDPEGAPAVPEHATRGCWRLLLGPEGGWSDAERKTLRASGAVSLCISPHTLRAETAAMAAVAVLSFLLGRHGPSHQA